MAHELRYFSVECRCLSVQLPLHRTLKAFLYLSRSFPVPRTSYRNNPSKVDIKSAVKSSFPISETVNAVILRAPSVLHIHGFYFLTFFFVYLHFTSSNSIRWKMLVKNSLSSAVVVLSFCICKMRDFILLAHFRRKQTSPHVRVCNLIQKLITNPFTSTLMIIVY